MARMPPGLSLSAREAILHSLASQHCPTAVPISRILRDIRTEFPALPESDDDLIQHIVMEATDHGLAVHFDSPREED